jgi:hypothetical protein
MVAKPVALWHSKATARVFGPVCRLTLLGCGCSSGVEHNLAKVGVEGSNPFARSKKSSAKSTHLAENASSDGASRRLNKPRTVPTCPPDLGKWRAVRSRKVPEGPPDPQMRRPAPLEQREPNRRGSKSQKDITPHHADPQDYDRELSVYDGTIWIGNVKQNGRRFDAFSTVPAYRFIGSFGSLKEAFGAVSEAAGDVP